MPTGSQDVTLADLLPDTAPGPLSLVETTELKQAVRTALTQLPPAQRAVIVLRFYLQLTEQEMSNLMSTPLGTIKWRLHAARKQLEVLLRPLMDHKG